MTELLRTERLLLRHWTPADLPAFFDIYSRDEVTRWLGPQPRAPLATIDAADRRLARWREVQLEPPLGLWAVVPLGATAPVGTCLLMPLNDAQGATGETEIGWHLHPDHQGRGYATEAAAGILTRTDSLPRVLALTDPDNLPSQAVANRLGMHDDGLTDRWFGLTTRQFSLDLQAKQ